MNIGWAVKPSAAGGLRASRARHASLKVLCKQRVSPRIVQSAPAKAKSHAQLTKKQLDQLYSSPDTSATVRTVGSVTVHNIAGKGRGLVATADVPPGELLLLCEPIGGASGVAWAPEGASLRPPDLLAHWRSLSNAIATHVAAAGGTAEAAGGTSASSTSGGTVLSGLTAGDRKRLLLLYHGEEEANALAVKKICLADFEAADVVPKPPTVSKGFGAPAKASAGGTSSSSGGAAAMTDERLEQVVALNSWGCEHGDFGVCGVSGAPSRSHIGVWPEFSLVNHSCAPNTVVFTVGQWLVVRAACAIPAGGEVTTSYIGPLGSAPLAQRRQYLQGAYGFQCGCPRCATESQQHAEVQAALDAAHAALEGDQAKQRVAAALAGGDALAVAACLHEAQRHVDAVEAAMERHQVHPQVRLWLRASVYGWHELRALCKDSQAEVPNAALPEALVPLMEVIAPASDAHLYLCLEWLTRVGEQLGTSHEVTEATARPCLGAHLRRYGHVSDNILSRLMMERAKVSHHMGRYDLKGQQGVLAPATAVAPVAV